METKQIKKLLKDKNYSIEITTKNREEFIFFDYEISFSKTSVLLTEEETARKEVTEIPFNEIRIIKANQYVEYKGDWDAADDPDGVCGDPFN